jgi:putative membrane protein
MRHDPGLSDAANLETPIQAAGGAAETRRSGVATASTLRKMHLAGLGMVLALPVAAQTIPQQEVTQELGQAGFTNVQVVPGSFVLHATDRDGRSVTVTVDPATPAPPPAPPVLPPDVAPASAAGAVTQLSNGDEEFLVAAAQSSNYESALSTLAVSQATAMPVKQYAQQFVSEHDAFRRSLQQIASANGVSLPQTPSADQQIQLDSFRGLTDSSFDYTYLQEMARIETLNQRTSDLEASLTTSPALKNFAQTSAPTAARYANRALALSATP